MAEKILFVYVVRIDSCEEYGNISNWVTAIFLPDQLEEARTLANNACTIRKNYSHDNKDGKTPYCGNEVTVEKWELPNNVKETVCTFNKAAEANASAAKIIAQVEAEFKPKIEQTQRSKEQAIQQRLDERLSHLLPKDEDE